MTPDLAPSIEEQLRVALRDVADCVGIDPLPSTWPADESAPRGRRTRVLALVGIAVVLAIGVSIAVKVAASAHDSTPHGSVSDPTPPTTARFIDDGPLTAPRVYRAGLISLMPPPKGTYHYLSAAEAYAAYDRNQLFPWRGVPPVPHLVLAAGTIFDYGTVHDGTVTPIIDHRLVWVVTFTDVPAANLGGPGGARPVDGAKHETTTTVDPSKPSGQTVLVFVDATTGEVLTAQGGASATPVPLECPAKPPARVPPHQVAGTASTMVPGNPIALLACRFHGFNQPQPIGTLARSAPFEPGPIAAGLNALAPVPKGAVFNCPVDFGEQIILIFGYADGSKLTISVDTSGCGFVNNGNRTARGEVPPQLQATLGKDSR